MNEALTHYLPRMHSKLPLLDEIPVETVWLRNAKMFSTFIFTGVAAFCTLTPPNKKLSQLLHGFQCDIHPDSLSLPI